MVIDMSSLPRFYETQCITVLAWLHALGVDCSASKLIFLPFHIVIGLSSNSGGEAPDPPQGVLPWTPLGARPHGPASSYHLKAKFHYAS